MYPEIKIIHQLCHYKIFESQLITQSDMKAWIANQNYLITRPLIKSTHNKASEFSLIIRNSSELYAALANDCNRFSQASIESIWLVNKNLVLPKSTGWAIVQLYYSAFYAAHALLRIFGRSCTQLTSEHVKKVYDVACATSQDNGVSAIENGFYSSIILGKEIEYKKLKDSHADTWYSFTSLLTWIINSISNTTGIGVHKTNAITLISDLKAMLTRSGASRGNWPSQIRNKVHYQHSHGAWFPYSGAIHNHNLLLKNLDWLNEPASFTSRYSDDISSLYNSCNCIVSLMYHLIKYGYERSGRSSYSMKNGIFRLLNQIKVAQN